MEDDVQAEINEAEIGGHHLLQLLRDLDHNANILLIHLEFLEDEAIEIDILIHD